jgi:hypothetical protein
MSLVIVSEVLWQRFIIMTWLVEFQGPISRYTALDPRASFLAPIHQDGPTVMEETAPGTQRTAAQMMYTLAKARTKLLQRRGIIQTGIAALVGKRPAVERNLVLIRLDGQMVWEGIARGTEQTAAPIMHTLAKARTKLLQRRGIIQT